MGVTSLWLVLVFLVVTASETQECHESLGMEDGAISDRQITASSEFTANHAANQGRLHFQATRAPLPWKSGGWSALTNDVNQWLQVDLRDRYIIATRVATQGRNDLLQWVTTYKLQYGNDEETFKYYKGNGQTTDKIFAGNTDQNTVVSHELNPPIRARYIRFRPVTWNWHITMRVEIYGCKADQMAAVFIMSGFGKALSGHVISSNYAADSFECMQLCLMTAQCKSFNFSEKKRSCEVSGYTAKEKKQDYGDNEDFDYYEPIKHTVINLDKE